MRYLNAGCGGVYSKDEVWVNADFNSKNSSDVQAVNLLDTLPWSDNEFDLVYSSHMLEHFTKVQGECFLHESYRILKPGGVLRIVVPDLEDVCKEYIRVLEGIRNGNEDEENYNTIILDLIDQMTRTYSGGLLQQYFISGKGNPEYLEDRFGHISAYIPESDGKKMSSFKLIKKRIWNKIYVIRDRFCPNHKYKVAGKFALYGELHKWMYDSYSLKKLFESVGFKNVQILSHNESTISDWGEYHLDTNEDGTAYKHHSIYIEGKK